MKKNKNMAGEKVSTLGFCQPHADGKFRGMWSSRRFLGGLTQDPQPTQSIEAVVLIAARSQSGAHVNARV